MNKPTISSNYEKFQDKLKSKLNKSNNHKWDSQPLVDKRDAEMSNKGENTSLIKQYNKIIKYQKIHYNKLKDFKKDLRLPEQGELIKIRVCNNYNAFTFILAILEKHKQIEELTLITYSINDKTLSSIFDMIEQDLIKKFNFCISNSIKGRHPEKAQQIKTYFRKYKSKIPLKIAFTYSHAKLSLIEAGNNYYIIEGSGNYSENGRIEQYVFENSKESYDFDKNGILKELFESAKSDKDKETQYGEMLK